MYQNNRELMHNASILECLQAYSDPFKYRPNLFMVSHQSGYSNLYKTSTYGIVNRTVLDWTIRSSFGGANFASASLCDEYSAISFYSKGYCSRLSNGLTLEQAHEYATTGHPWHLPVDHCIMDRSNSSQNFQAQHECHLQCSPPILLSTYASSTARLF